MNGDDITNFLDLKIQIQALRSALSVIKLIKGKKSTEVKAFGGSLAPSLLKQAPESCPQGQDA